MRAAPRHAPSYLTHASARALHRCLATCASAAAGAEVLAQEREELQREREQQREAGRRRRGQEQQRGWSSACRRRRRHGLRGRRGAGSTVEAAQHLARRGSARLEKTVLPSRDVNRMVNRSRKRAGLLTTSSSVEASMSPSFSSPISPLYLFSSISICTLRARRLAPCGVSPPGLLPVRAPSVVSHHLRRLSPPLLASRAHSIGFR